MTRLRIYFFSLVFSSMALADVSTPAYALDPNGAGASKGNSMDDVARMIRQTSRWQILEATPKKKGAKMRYRFKLISSSGKVKIISIDPLRPNLRKLEQ